MRAREEKEKDERESEEKGLKKRRKGGRNK